MLLTVDQVAARLQCSRTNVYALEKSGQLASIRVGSDGAGIRFDDAEVQRFINSGGVRKKLLPKEKKPTRRVSLTGVKHYDVAALLAASKRRGVPVDPPSEYIAPSSLPSCDPSTEPASSGPRR